MTTKQKTITEAVAFFLNKENASRKRFDLLHLGYRVELFINPEFYRKPNSENRTLAIKLLMINGNCIAIVKTVSNKIFIDKTPCDSLTDNLRTLIFKEIIKQAGESFAINEDITGERLRLVTGAIYRKNRYYELMSERGEVNND